MIGRVPLHQAAGIVVARSPAGGPLLLMVSDREASGRWLFPKGDIEPGESAAHAAQRETYEEANVRAEPWRSVGQVRYRDGRFDVDIEFVLLRYRGESAETIERRERRWVTPEQAAGRHHLGPRIRRTMQSVQAALRSGGAP